MTEQEQFKILEEFANKILDTENVPIDFELIFKQHFWEILA